MIENYLEVKDGRLLFDNTDVTAVAKEYGTPLFLLSKNKLVDNIIAFTDAFKKHYPQGVVQYAGKAFCCKEIYRIIKPLGLQSDVVSIGEMYTAISAGFEASKIYFHGNNKTVDDISYAMQQNIGCFVADNMIELELLADMSCAAKQHINVMLRIKPEVDAHTHEYIQTGKLDSKFGLALTGGEAERAFSYVVNAQYLNLLGVHCHIGSQIFETEPFVLAATRLLEFANEMKNKTGYTISELNLGGGFGIRYTGDDSPKPQEEYIKLLAKSIKDYCNTNEFPLPKLIIEPGRSIVGDTCMTLYTVGGIKEIEGVRSYVSIDGGMADNPRFALYQSLYDFCIANHADSPADYLCTIAGRCCESGDLLGKDVLIAKPSVGDTLAVLCTGAYNYSMASNYNRLQKPAVVLIEDGKTRVIVRRQTLEDLVKEDI